MKCYDLYTAGKIAQWSLTWSAQLSYQHEGKNAIFLPPFIQESHRVGNAASIGLEEESLKDRHWIIAPWNEQGSKSATQWLHFG